MSEQPESIEDERGHWTVSFDGGPALAGNLAVLVRIAARRDWPNSPDTQAAMFALAASLDDAAFAPVREIQIRRRDPEEARARLLTGPLPPDLAAALADEITP